MNNSLNQNLTSIAGRIVDTLNLTGYPEVSTLIKLKTDLEQLLTVLNRNRPSISNVSSDFHSLLIQLQEHIRKEDTWKDFYISSSGQTLLDLIAAVGAFLQNSVHIAFREGFSGTAVRDSSRYEIANMLGVRISRKNPAMVKTWLRRSDSSDALHISAYEQFVIDGLEYFNPKPIIFPTGEATLPHNLQFDELGNAYEGDATANVFLGELIFPDDGQIYYPCTGTIKANYNGQVYEGEIKIVNDESFPNSAFGSITFDSSNVGIVPASLEFQIELSQFNSISQFGTFKCSAGSAFLRLPATIGFQLKRTGVGSSVITPAVGTANIPNTAIIVTPEEFSVVKNKYLLPQYLDKSILIYDNNIELCSGRVQVLEHTVVQTQPFYSIRLNQPGFNVADSHIYMEVFDGQNAEVWTRAEFPLYEYGPDDKVFVDSTLGDGDCRITFGDGVHGKRVESSWVIGIRYVLTMGAISNNGVPGARVTNSRFNLVGATLTPPYGGADEKSSSYYTTIGPSLTVQKGRAITNSDAESVILSYPGVADVVILGQKDIASQDIRFMNKALAIVLPESPKLQVYPDNSLMAGRMFDSTITNPKDPNEPNIFKFSDFVLSEFQTRFSKSKAALLDYDFHVSAVPVPTQVKVKIFVNRRAKLDVVQSTVLDNIKKLFMRGHGCLGRSLMLVDLSAAITVADVDYVEIIYPTADIILGDGLPDKYSFICLDSSPEVLVEYTKRRDTNA